MYPGKLSCMVGLARSGKTTKSRLWIKGAHRGIRMMDGGMIDLAAQKIVISGDDIRLAMHGQRYIQYAEPLVHGIIPIFVRALLLNGLNHVLLDETNTSRKTITAIYQLVPRVEEWIYLDTPPSVCKERALATNQPDLVSVIDHMHTNLLDLCGLHPKDWQDKMPTENMVMEAIYKIRDKVVESHIYDRAV